MGMWRKLVLQTIDLDNKFLLKIRKKYIFSLIMKYLVFILIPLSIFWQKEFEIVSLYCAGLPLSLGLVKAGNISGVFPCHCLQEVFTNYQTREICDCKWGRIIKPQTRPQAEEAAQWRGQAHRPLARENFS